MSILTKQGDRGKTRLYSGEEVSKNDVRLSTYGTLDELVSFLGMARTSCTDKKVLQDIFKWQKTLFRLGTELAVRGKSGVETDPIRQSDVEEIEDQIVDYEEKTELPRHFIIPGSNKSEAILDVCRAVCRRFERLLVGLYDSGDFTNQHALTFTNRLSYLLFLMARKEEGPQFLIAFSTIDSEKEATKIAKFIVKEGLAACVNIVPGLKSIYQWQGKICDTKEFLMVIKTHAQNQDKLKSRIKKLHHYDVPELIFMPITNGLEDYLAWLESNTTCKSSDGD